MNKEEKLQTLKDLINHNFLLNKESKHLIFEKLDNLSEGQITALIKLLQDADKKQQVIIQKIMEKNPDFMHDLENISRNGIREFKKNKEIRSRVEEQEQISQLEKEIANI